MRVRNDRGLLYITEDSGILDHATLAKELGGEIVAVTQLASKHLRHDPHLIFHFDLRNTSLVSRLGTLLLKRGQGCRIFLVDPKIRIARAYATTLGANHILPHDCGADAIDAILRLHARGAADAGVLPSIEAGIAALDGGFRALLRDESFDTEGMEQASSQIIDAIDSAGVDDWIATVRGYHAGTFQHCMLVTATASSFARNLGLRRSDVIKVTAAALVHDIGKASIPIEILDKNGPLTPEELRTMRQHPVIGHDYLARRSRIAADALRSVRSHHEYLDGSGYPDGLSGADIDDITRIITISDIYSALIERRAYKPPMRPDAALAVLEDMACTGKLELALVRAFARVAVRREAA